MMILAENDVSSLALYSAIFAAVVFAGFVVLFVLKKKLDPRNVESGSSQGLSLEQLDEMHDAGQISDEEFKKLRRALLGIVEKKVENSEENSDIINDSDESSEQEH